MSSVLSTVLISAPVAFLVGWLLSKAVFQHLLLIRPNPGVSPEQPSVPVAKPVVNPAEKKPAAAQPTDAGHADLKPTRSEIQLLKEAVAERDHLIGNLKQQLAAKPVPLEYTPDNVAAQETKLRQTVKALSEGLTTKEQQLEQLQTALRTAEETSVKTQRRFQSWRARFKIVVKQFRQQKLIIHELREELKQRELQQRKLEIRQQQKKPAISKRVPASTVSNSNELRVLRSVGPAMQAKLHEQGIYRLKQLADMNSAAQMILGAALSISEPRMAKNDWADQARQLLNQPATVSPLSSTENETAIAS